MGGYDGDNPERLAYWVDARDYAIIVGKTGQQPAMFSSEDSSLATDKAILAVGMLGIDGWARLEDWYILKGAPISPLKPGPYAFEYRDAANNLIAERSFTASFWMEGVEQQEVPFVLAIPYVEGAEKIMLMHDDSPLASKSISAHAPVVEVKSPAEGTRLSRLVEIKWTASDVDGDDLSYAVLVSVDGGTNWETLVLGHSQPAFWWNASMYPAGDQYRIKVIATDGLRIGEDVSNGTFTLLDQSFLPLLSHQIGN
jgi:hypothetical protein